MDAILTQYDFRQDRFWVWIGMAIACAWIIGLNILILFSMEIFNRKLSVVLALLHDDLARLASRM